MKGRDGILQLLWRRVPEEVRDEYAMMQYDRLKHQVTRLYVATVLIVLAAMACANPESSPLLSIGVPLVVAGTCIYRMIVWHRRPPVVHDVAAARQLVNRSRLVSGGIASLCSVWAVYIWSSAPQGTVAFVPLFMAMGTIATVSCVAITRLGTLYNLVGAMAPMGIALLISGDLMAMAAGLSMLVASAFIMQLVLRQHDKNIELLLLQNRMRALAETDPLTGLANRRALLDRLHSAIAEAAPMAGPALLVLDLDGFKPVNDRHGHAEGDEVLRQVARRLAEVGGEKAVASRLGGDEFAVLLLPNSGTTADALGTALLAALARPFAFEGNRLHVGASLGIACWPGDGITAEDLLRHADRALYVAKSGRSRSGAVAARFYAVRKA